MQISPYRHNLYGRFLLICNTKRARCNLAFTIGGKSAPHLLHITFQKSRSLSWTGFFGGGEAYPLELPKRYYFLDNLLNGWFALKFIYIVFFINSLCCLALFSWIFGFLEFLAFELITQAWKHFIIKKHNGFSLENPTFITDLCFIIGA